MSWTSITCYLNIHNMFCSHFQITTRNYPSGNVDVHNFRFPVTTVTLYYHRLHLPHSQPETPNTEILGHVKLVPQSHEEVYKPSSDQLKGRTLVHCSPSSPHSLWLSVGSVKYSRLWLSSKHSVFVRASWLVCPHGTAPVVANAADISGVPAGTEGRSSTGDEQEEVK
jgi:hypothetical protein